MREINKEIAKKILSTEKSIDMLMNSYKGKTYSDDIKANLVYFGSVFDEISSVGDYESRVIAYRVQALIGRIVHTYPNFISDPHCAAAIFKINVDPGALEYAILNGIHHIRGLDSHHTYIKSGMSAVLAGGVTSKDLNIFDAYSKSSVVDSAFANYKSTSTKVLSRAAVAVDFFSHLYGNTIRYSSFISDRTLDNNLLQILSGLSHFGGMKGTQLAISLIPEYLNYAVDNREARWTNKEEMSIEQKTAVVANAIVRITSSSNIVFGLKELYPDAHAAYIEHTPTWNAVSMAVMSDNNMFDLVSLGNSEQVKKMISVFIARRFNNKSPISIKAANSLMTHLKYLGFNKREIKSLIAIECDTNGIGGDYASIMMAITLGLMDQERSSCNLDSLSECIKKAEEINALPSGELIDKLEELSERIHPNLIVAAIALNEKSVIEILNKDSIERELISSILITHSGYDLLELINAERSSISRMEMAALSSLFKDREKGGEDYSLGFFNPESISKFSIGNEVTRKSYAVITHDFRSYLLRKFGEWFNHSYIKNIVWEDNEIKGKDLEDALGI